MVNQKKNKNKTISIMTFAQKNGRPSGTIGSSVIRGEWLADKWKEAEIFTEGKKFDVNFSKSILE